MSRLLKILFGIVGVFVLLVLGIAAAVYLLFDPNEYRGEIATLVEEQTGRTFSIDGELSLRVLPCCAVAIEDTRLGNPPGFEEPDFASISSLRLGLQLWPLLLERRVVVDEVTLDGLMVKLHRRADGVANWVFEEGQVKTGPEEDAPPPESAVDLSTLSVAGVHIGDARIELRDDQAGTNFSVEQLNVATGPVAIGEPINIEVSLRARDVSSQASIVTEFSSSFLLTEDMARAELANLNATVQLTTPDLPKTGVNIDLTGGPIRADLNSGAIELADIRSDIRVAGMALAVHANGTVEGEHIALSGDVVAPPFSPRDVLAELGQPPIETADASALGEAEFKADWSLTGERIDVTALNLRLDDSLITGQLGSNYADQMATTFDFELDSIDLDRYLAPQPEEDATAAASAADSAELPVETLRTLDIEGRVAVGRLTANGLLLQNLVAKITARNGVIRIDPSTADIYGGRYEGQMEMDVRGDVPQVSFRQSLSAVQAGGLLADLYDAANLEGVLQARIDGSGSGRTPDELTRGLAGSVALDLGDAVYKGVDVWYEIRKAVARIKGKPMPAVPASPETQITALGFAGRLADGTLQSDKLVAEIPFIRVEGGGAFDLLQNQLDYRLQARMLSRPNFPDADDLADLERVTIPITVTGDATAPTIGIDLEELAKDAAVQKVQDRLLKKLGLEEPEDDAGTEGNATDQSDPRDDARQLLKKGLRDLFKP